MSSGSAPPGADFDALLAEVARLDASPEEDAVVALAEWLGHRSWALRDRVVEALARRGDSAPHVLRVVEHGDWWARASACDVLARQPDAAYVAALLRALEDRNVSLQRSAVRALMAIAENCGALVLAKSIAELVPESRRRVIARIGHQAPHDIDELLLAIAAQPQAAVHPERPAAPSSSTIARDETHALRRFRDWLLARADIADRATSLR